MCLAIPAQVIAVKSDTALVEIGETRSIVGRWLVPEAQPGDWVLVNSGQMVSAVSPEEAEAVRELWRELMALERADEHATPDPLLSGSTIPPV